jgi:hypothetical protein
MWGVYVCYAAIMSICSGNTEYSRVRPGRKRMSGLQRHAELGVFPTLTHRSCSAVWPWKLINAAKQGLSGASKNGMDRCEMISWLNRRNENYNHGVSQYLHEEKPLTPIIDPSKTHNSPPSPHEPCSSEAIAKKIRTSLHAKR